MKSVAHSVFAGYADMWGSGSVDLRDFHQTPEEFGASVQALVWNPALFPEEPQLIGRIDGGKALEYYVNYFGENFEQLRWSRYPDDPQECITHHEDPSVPGPEAFPAYNFESITEEPVE